MGPLQPNGPIFVNGIFHDGLSSGGFVAGPPPNGDAGLYPPTTALSRHSRQGCRVTAYRCYASPASLRPMSGRLPRAPAITEYLGFASLDPGRFTCSSTGDLPLHPVQIVVQFVHAGEDLLGRQGLDDVEHLLDLRLKVEQNHLAIVRFHGFLRLGDDPDAHTGDVVELFHVEHEGVGLFMQYEVDAFFHGRIGVCIQPTDRGDNVNPIHLLLGCDR
ncbi:hypothetical protein DESC_780360 [Desulfosarcina cetonica]|nr:hypothetical protein DESC_780360 [Desulfosarcina cetonica]